MALHKNNPWWTEKYEISSLCCAGGVSFQARKENKFFNHDFLLNDFVSTYRDGLM